jgi:NADH:ubiquinone oxidoreductase subunit 6 (subunit J)
MALLGMSGELWAFLILGGITIAGAVFAVASKRTFHSVLGLGVVLLAIGGIYIVLGSALLGVVQVLVYVGGILTLFVFALMFVAGDETEEDAEAEA